jgi:V/A-type H+-transporting ATPase subunit K
MNEPEKKLKSQIIQSVIAVFTILAILGTLFCSSAFAQGTSPKEETIAAEMSQTKADVMKFGLIAAAIAFGLGAIGAGFAISHVGAAAMGAVAEKPEIAGQALIFVALAEGLVVFGFITALMILGKL